MLSNSKIAICNGSHINCCFVFFHYFPWYSEWLFSWIFLFKKKC